MLLHWVAPFVKPMFASTVAVGSPFGCVRYSRVGGDWGLSFLLLPSRSARVRTSVSLSLTFSSNFLSLVLAAAVCNSLLRCSTGAPRLVQYYNCCLLLAFSFAISVAVGCCMFCSRNRFAAACREVGATKAKRYGGLV